MRVTMLGCGSSGGVPLITGHWGACDAANPRNRRRRPSILVEVDGRSILVDTGPDLRSQMLGASCRQIDAVLYTHAHADHVHGIDDLRPFNYATGRAIDAYGHSRTLKELANRFSYVFESSTDQIAPLRPRLTPHPVEQSFEAVGTTIIAFDQQHGSTTSTGFRFGQFAYSTDVSGLDDAAFATLKGVEVWIVGCLSEQGHPMHAGLVQVLQWIERVNPRRAILTHMNHTLDYAQLTKRLPRGVEPGYDGMQIDL